MKRLIITAKEEKQMNRVRNSDRDDEIRKKRKDGMGLKELAEMYGFSIARAGKICEGIEPAKKKKQPEPKPPKDREKRWIVKCGGADAYLTEITPEQLGHTPIYTYGTKDKKKAMKMTREEAETIAKQRHAEVRWV